MIHSFSDLEDTKLYPHFDQKNILRRINKEGKLNSYRIENKFPFKQTFISIAIYIFIYSY